MTDVNSTATISDTKQYPIYLNLLVAEDEVATAGLYKLWLESKGHKVTLVHDGQECLNAYQMATRPFDVVILDYRMPILNGAQVAKQIRQLNSKQKIVIETAYQKDSVMNLIADLKADIEIIQKPFDFQQLLEVIEGIIA